MKEQLDESIEKFKQVLDTLPTNNIKNRQNKIKIINDELTNIKEKRNEIKTQLLNFKNKFDSLIPNPKIKILDDEIEKCKIQNEWNIYNTPYEKLHLDYYLYFLHYYYKEDLESVNSWILKMFLAFKQVGIEITKEQFNYNTFAKNYIEVLLTIEDKNLIKQKFDDLYWKYPLILKTIELNIKSIYLKNEKKIIRYYESRHEEFMRNHKDEEIIGLFTKLISNRSIMYETDPYYIIKNFTSKKWSINDYKTNNINKKIEKFFPNGSVDKTLIQKLYQTLLEYNLILKYSGILEDMKVRLNEKETYKGKRNNTLKEIDKVERSLIKLNIEKNEKKTGIFKNKKRDDKLLFKYNETLDKLSTLYDNLDTENFNDRIYNNLTKDSSIKEVFKYISSNFLYFVSERKKEDENLDINNLNDEFIELQNILNKNNFVFIDNIALLDEQNIDMIITDKYNLESIKLTKEDLDINTLENTMNDILTLINYENIKMSNLSLKDIEVYLEMQNINFE